MAQAVKNTAYVIIGTGPAGVAAAESIRQNDPQGSITLIGEEPEGYYSRPGLAYYLTDEVPENQLFPFSEKEFHNLKVQRVKAQATAIHPQTKQVELQNRQALSYDRLLIATGAEAVAMDIPGIHSEGVVKLDNLADARHIMRLARRARSAVVVGGGITALELVEGLICHKVKVHYLLRGDRYWSNVLDEAESRIVEHRLKEDGVQIHYNSELGEILVKSGRVVGVQTRFTKTGERERGENQEGENIKCDILAVAIGVRPRLGLAKAAGIQIERGILVNEYLETNLPNIYAAGDVAQVYDPFSGKSVLDSLWSPARDMGTVAGFNMALSTTLDRSGQKTSYLKGVSINVTRLAHLTTTIIGGVGHGRDADMVGIARGDSEAWRHMPDAITVQDNQQVNRLRLLVGEQYLLGAIVMGDQSISLPLQQMIAQKVNILPIREQLFQSDAPLAQIILDYWKNNKPSAVKNTV